MTIPLSSQIGGLYQNALLKNSGGGLGSSTPSTAFGSGFSGTPALTGGIPGTTFGGGLAGGNLQTASNPIEAITALMGALISLLGGNSPPIQAPQAGIQPQLAAAGGTSPLTANSNMLQASTNPLQEIGSLLISMGSYLNGGGVTPANGALPSTGRLGSGIPGAGLGTGIPGTTPTVDIVGIDQMVGSTLGNITTNLGSVGL